MLESPFKSGTLLLDTVPPPETAIVAEPSPWLVHLLVVIFTVLAIMTLKRFLQVVPYMADSYLRVRGSAALEGSIRVSQDRNLVALVLVIPFVLVAYRYRLFNPEIIQDLVPNLRLAAIAVFFLSYILVRHLIYLWLRPRRRQDAFRQAHRVAYTFFIFLVLVTLGVLLIAGVEDAFVRYILYAEIALVFVLFLRRSAQILSLSCNRLRTFLYLCALEILPAALLVISGSVL